jgi:hypothetical protein
MFEGYEPLEPPVGDDFELFDDELSELDVLDDAVSPCSDAAFSAALLAASTVCCATAPTFGAVC